MKPATGLTFLSVSTLLLSTAAPIFAASEAIRVKVSVKVILDDAGQRGADGFLTADAQIDGAGLAANAILEANGADWRLEIDEIVDVAGAAQWFGPFDCLPGTYDLEAEAKAAPELFAWRGDAINVYVVNDLVGCSGYCSFPRTGHDIITIESQMDDALAPAIELPPESDSYVAGHILLHEIGHFFDLCHTQGCGCQSCRPDREGECHTEPGDDGIDDTLPDLACWTRDDIARRSFQTEYELLLEEEQKMVDDVAMNVMSYHLEPFVARRSYLTAEQLERAAVEMDPATGSRRHVLRIDCAGDCPEVSFRRGDANADDTVNLSDPIFVLNWLFLGAEGPSCHKAADGTDDGLINLSSLVYVLNFLFMGGEPPGPPGVGCGNDPTADSLTCESYPPCAS